VYLGRFDEAIDEIERALESDPLSMAIIRDVGEIHYLARNYDKAIEALKRAIDMDPNFAVSHFNLGLVYLQKSRYEEAIQEFQKEKETSKGTPDQSFDPVIEAHIGIAYARMDNKDEAQQILERLKAIEGLYYWKAMLCFSVGEIDKGFEYLNKESKQPGNNVYVIKVDPLADSVRSDPRAKAFLRKENLE